jgi:hypothetical protein
MRALTGFFFWTKEPFDVKDPVVVRGERLGKSGNSGVSFEIPYGLPGMAYSWRHHSGFAL